MQSSQKLCKELSNLWEIQFTRVQDIYILQKRKIVEGRSKKKPEKEGGLIVKSLMNNN